LPIVHRYSSCQVWRGGAPLHRSPLRPMQHRQR
jgi:hypothetical protein